ncbi:hypothetical protein LTS12_028079, partial [Elasticomyces elasticus]
MFGLSIAFLYVYDTGLPWYGLVLSIAIIVVLLVPTGIMLAICNIQLSTAAISALIAGYAWPGMMMNNVVFKVFTLVSSVQGLGYVKDMKIGYYMFLCPLASGYATNAVFWGLIGPKHLFSSGSMYRPMLWFFLIGALLPILFWAGDYFFPGLRLRK